MIMFNAKIELLTNIGTVEAIFIDVSNNFERFGMLLLALEEKN